MFINLCNNTTYSLSKGAILIEDLVKLAASCKMPALGICDDSNIFGALEFSLKCKEYKIQPIIGSHISLQIEEKPEDEYINYNEFQNSLVKIPVFTKNFDGFKNLSYLLTKAYQTKSKITNEKYIKLNDLIANMDGLIILSGFENGVIDKFKNNLSKLDEIANILKNNFRDDFYIELNRYIDKKDDYLESLSIDIAIKNKIPLVATNKTLFLTPDMHEAQDILSCIGEGRVINDDSRIKYSKEQYFKNIEEMTTLFADIPESIENTIKIAKKCQFLAKERPPTLPKFSTEPDFNEIEDIKNKSNDGLKKRLENKIKVEKVPKSKIAEINKLYQERLDYELSIITKMNFSGYFLIVSDFIKWAKNNDIPVGPGRGSGAGSLVAWALEITDLDPIRFGLLFERFLNPERVSMPDFDIDFCQSRRDEVIDYVQNKYGHEYVAQIITFGKLQARAVLKDVGRVLQMPYNQVDRICKLIPFNAVEAVTLQKAITMDQELQNAIKDDTQIKYLVDICLKLEGLNRHASTHAAGIVIGDKPLHEICMLYQDDNSTMPAVGYSMKYAEKAGLIKFDFLGLKTLTTISDTVKLIKLNRNIDIDITNIDLSDKRTFDMLASGNSIGVFQIESSGMRSVLRQMKADKIEDIIALISLYRPGPMDNIPTYIRRKHKEEEIIYPHPILENVLKETYGVIVYQEQVMEIAKILAGYSLGEADLLRRAMGKKIKQEMDQQREIFVQGAVRNNIDPQRAEDIFNLVDKFAGYGFNKSHAAAYAMISYQTAYLKAHFPVEFITSSINLEIDNSDKINIFLQLAKDCKIKILPPDINKSYGLFTIEKL